MTKSHSSAFLSALCVILSGAVGGVKDLDQSFVILNVLFVILSVTVSS